jgi:hypothetical protein
METAIQNTLTQLYAILVAIGSTASMAATLPPPPPVPSADLPAIVLAPGRMQQGLSATYAITVKNELTGTAANTGTFSTVRSPRIDPNRANNAASVSTVVAATLSRPPSNASFVAANGNDTNDCKTEATPCRTIEKINAGTYAPGTTIRFRGGDSFPGALTITPTQVPSKGDTTNPIVIDSYGTGRATILANAPGVNNGNLGPKSYAVKIDGVSGVTLQNLIVSANDTKTQFGVLVQNSFGGVADTITVQGLEVSGFNITASQDFSSEIFITGWAYPSNAAPTCGNLANIKVLNNTLHGASGISSSDDNGITGQDCRNLTNVTYSGNTVYNIGGRPGQGGNGIIFIGVINGLAERNRVYDMAANVKSCGGPAGIWAYHSDHITIQLNEVHHMHALAWQDGACDWAAFDADSGTQYITFQYNYSHDNDGPAFLAYGGEGLPHGPTIIRYNISVNDNLTTNDGGGSISIPTNGVVQVYNNTIYKAVNVKSWTPSSCWSGSYGFTGTLPAGSIYANNLCVNLTNDLGFRMVYALPLALSWTNFALTHNLYFSAGRDRWIWIGNQVEPTTLSAWQSASGKDDGAIVADPMFANPSAGTAAGFALTHGSPAIGAGVDLTQPPFNLNVGARDYFGNPVSKNIGADAAAHQ